MVLHMLDICTIPHSRPHALYPVC